MDSYDIIFVGHVAIDQIVPYSGSEHSVQAGAVLYSAMAATLSGKRLAVVTKMAEKDEYFLTPIRERGIAVYLLPSLVTTHMHVVYPTTNVDERQIFQKKSAGFFSINDLSAIEPCFAYLSGITNQEFTLEFMYELKERGFTLAVDMQSFIRQVDQKTNEILMRDVWQKRDIFSMADKVKLDAVEARLLTGTDNLEEAAMRLEKNGATEILITRRDGVLAYHKSKTYFEKYSNRNSNGRTGRGDTTFGAYLAHRIDHSVVESLTFATAIASIKMETPGPFKGSLEDVLNRIKASHS